MAVDHSFSATTPSLASPPLMNCRPLTAVPMLSLLLMPRCADGVIAGPADVDAMRDLGIDASHFGIAQRAYRWLVAVGAIPGGYLAGFDPGAHGCRPAVR